MDSLFDNLPDIIREAAQSPLGLIALVVCAISTIAIILFRGAGPKVTVPIFILLLLSAAAFVWAMILHDGGKNGGDNGDEDDLIRIVTFAGDGADTGVVEADATSGGNRVQKDNTLHMDLTFSPVIEPHKNGTFRVYVKVNGEMKITGHMANTDVRGYFQNEIIYPKDGPMDISDAKSVEFVMPADNPNFFDPVELKRGVPGPEDDRHRESVSSRFIDRIEVLGMHKLQVYFNKVDLRVENQPENDEG